MLLFLLFFIKTFSQPTFINSGTPSGVTTSFDCAVRQYAYEYGQSLLPRHNNFITLFDALQLQICNITRPKPIKTTKKQLFNKNIKSDSCTFYADPINGNDNNDGTSISSAVKTIEKSIDLTRNNRQNNELCIINLLNGTFYQTNTINLTPMDSYLTIQAYQNSNVVISGGQPLEFEGNWIKYGNYQPKQWIQYNSTNNVFARVDVSDAVIFLGIYNTYNECEQMVISSNNNQTYGIFRSFTWHDLNFNDYQGHCYGIRDFSWQPMIQSNVYSGRLIGNNIWSRKVTNINKEITGLRINNLRGIRARYPDNIPEIMMEYDSNSGWITYNTNWLPNIPTNNGQSIIINSTNYPNVIWPMNYPDGYSYDGEGDWGNYYIGYNGTCSSNLKLGGFIPEIGYWCSVNPPRDDVNDGIQPHMTPSGLYINENVLINSNKYNDLSQCIISSWRPFHWFNWFWSIDNNNNYDKINNKILFNRGGFQGAEGTNYSDIWYIENIFEELTMENEYFYNTTTQTLYYFNNETSNNIPPSDNTLFIATNLKNIFNITGISQNNPITNITISGIEFRDTRKIYMDDHGMPSSGDWALQRYGGVILIENCLSCLINNNKFIRIDNIGIQINGFNRYIIIENNDFEWIGASAITAWGYTEGLERYGFINHGPDGRNGNQPRGTIIRGNMARELGIWEKQSSFYFQALACETEIYDNVVFNIPRAGINQNDGFGGHNKIHDNLIINTCRESGDHGPFNSWDRLPYITNIKNGTSSIIPGQNYIYKNFMIGNYQTVSSIDNDDGSSYYNISNNFFIYGDMGLKSDYGAHDIYHYNNIYGYVDNAFEVWGYSGANDLFYNNKVILRNNNGYQSNCNLGNGTKGFQIYNNSVYLESGELQVCGMSFQDWQKEGNDIGTTINKLPSDQQIIDWAKNMLS